MAASTGRAAAFLSKAEGPVWAEIDRCANDSEVARRLMILPGIGPLTATAIATFVPPPETFRNTRYCAVWLGHVPQQRSTDGKVSTASALSESEMQSDHFAVC